MSLYRLDDDAEHTCDREEGQDEGQVGARQTPVQAEEVRDLGGLELAEAEGIRRLRGKTSGRVGIGDGTACLRRPWNVSLKSID